MTNWRQWLLRYVEPGFRPNATLRDAALLDVEDLPAEVVGNFVQMREGVYAEESGPRADTFLRVVQGLPPAVWAALYNGGATGVAVTERDDTQVLFGDEDTIREGGMLYPAQRAAAVIGGREDWATQHEFAHILAEDILHLAECPAVIAAWRADLASIRAQGGTFECFNEASGALDTHATGPPGGTQAVYLGWCPADGNLDGPDVGMSPRNVGEAIANTLEIMWGSTNTKYRYPRLRAELEEMQVALVALYNEPSPEEAARLAAEAEARRQAEEAQRRAAAQEAEQQRLAAERQAREAEEARKTAEAQRLEEERAREAEEQRRLAEQAEQQRLEAEQQAREETERQQQTCTPPPEGPGTLEALQQRLWDEGYYAEVNDTRSIDLTRQVDGKWGPNTLEAFTRYLQRSLEDLGHDPQGVDGDFGPKTGRALLGALGLRPDADSAYLMLAQAQDAVGVDPDGIPGQNTAMALMEKLEVLKAEHAGPALCTPEQPAPAPSHSHMRPH
jgi:peptidoglycan hydrolase-like protein with peptidoglycan-binding domain